MKTLLILLFLSLPVLSSFAQSEPDSPRDINAFANMYNEISNLMRQGRFRDAVNKTNSALKIDPKNARLYTNLGTAYSNLNEPEKAEEAYRKAVSLEPDFYEANFNLASMLLNKAIRKNNSLSKSGKTEKQYGKELKEIAKEADKAYPFILKCTQLRPSDQDAANMMKYYRVLKQQ